MTVTKVFVYGTLMRGGRLHRLLSNSPFQGEGFVCATLFDTGSGYPAMVKGLDKMTEQTLGEVYEVDEETLVQLDQVEGVNDDHYTREQTVVSLMDGYTPKDFSQHERTRRDSMVVKLMTAWAYFQTDAQTLNLPRIKSGDWRDWEQRKVLSSK